MSRPPRTAVLLGITALLALGLPSPARAQAPADGLRLRPGDAVRLQMATEPELAGDYEVGEDGRLLLPLVGFVDAADRPFGDVRNAIRAAYAKELAQPWIAVTPLVRIGVLGEVRVPGLIPADPSMTLAELVAAAGGVGPDGDPRRVRVLRDGTELEYSLDDGSSTAYALRSGDQVIVGRKGWASRNTAALVGATASVLTAVLTALILR